MVQLSSSTKWENKLEKCESRRGCDQNVCRT